MKKGKRLAAILLSLGLLMALTGCQNSSDDPKSGASQTDNTTTSNDSTTLNNTTGTTAPATDDGKHIAFREDNGGTIGVWWWNNRLATNQANCTKYLDFLQSNQVSEIYIWASGMTNDQIATFIRASAARGMRVAWLSGDVSWIAPDNHAGADLVQEFIDYQNQAADDAKFYALHLDVEPHQRDDFGSNRDNVLQMYADYVLATVEAVHNAGYKIEWDIPFWFDNDRVKDQNGQDIALLELLAKTSDTLCLMSYRDTSGAILDVSKEEIALGQKYGCKIICGAETYSKEGDAVSFMEEGKVTMYKELSKVYAALKTKNLSGGYGIAIHHLNKWFDLKD